MAGNHSRALIEALVASVLVHASILYAPMSPFGLGDAKRHGAIDAVLLPPPGQEVFAGELRRVLPAPDQPVATTAEAFPRRALPAGPVASDATAALPALVFEPASNGSDTRALLPPVVSMPVIYYRPHQLTRRPVLRHPVLQEEAGRLYPVSETLILVRINETGDVDDVLLVGTSNPAMADESMNAFRGARYFPGMIGNAPAKAELLIQVVSSGASFTVMP